MENETTKEPTLLEHTKEATIFASPVHPVTGEPTGRVWVGIASPNPEDPTVLRLVTVAIDPATVVELAQDMVKAAAQVMSSEGLPMPKPAAGELPN